MSIVARTLTPADIADPKLTSGYRYVNREDSLSDRNVRNHPFRAQVQRGQHRDKKWRGPRRATAIEAAQDYCDFVNSQPGFHVIGAPTLKSAGHKRQQPQRPQASKALKRARARVRELEAKEREGSQGFLYLIGEEWLTAYPPRDPTVRLIAAEAVKIGWSVEPEARIASLQTGNPRKLVLLATKPGTLDDERALHAKYLGSNILQEWFRPTMPLLLEFGLRERIRSIDSIQVEGVVV